MIFWCVSTEQFSCKWKKIWISVVFSLFLIAAHKNSKIFRGQTTDFFSLLGFYTSYFLKILCKGQKEESKARWAEKNGRGKEGKVGTVWYCNERRQGKNEKLEVNTKKREIKEAKRKEEI